MDIVEISSQKDYVGEKPADRSQTSVWQLVQRYFMIRRFFSDEPTSGVDPVMRRNSGKLIYKFSKEGKTYLSRLITWMKPNTATG